MSPNFPLPNWQPYGERSVLLTWDVSDPTVVRQQVAHLTRALEALNPAQLLEWIPGLDSMALLFDPQKYVPADLEAVWKMALEYTPTHSSVGQTHTIPTCYHPDLAPDLLEVAQFCQLGVEELIEQHSASLFEVALLGFAPGFAYLEGLPTHLHMPRKTAPRVRVPAGSVAIGGAQCGIYPLESAGGWQLIGRTPVVLFNPQLESPSRFELGDWVRFEAISLKDFQEFQEAQEMVTTRIRS
jgi:KipI family sensor histidine kinase inhibitor